jgi:hypothetical protein
MADPIIKLGSTGEAVKKAQRALIHRYYLPPGPTTAYLVL